MLSRRANNKRTVHPLNPITSASSSCSSSTKSANQFSDISLQATDDPAYGRLAAVVMTKLRDRSTAAVAVDVVALIGCKQEEMVMFS